MELRFCYPIQLAFWFNFILPLILAGKNDTVEEFKVALGNLDLHHSFLNSPVQVTYGQVPLDLEGSFARHGCGVLGKYQYKSKSLNNFSCYRIILDISPHTKIIQVIHLMKKMKMFWIESIICLIVLKLINRLVFIMAKLISTVDFMIPILLTYFEIFLIKI